MMQERPTLSGGIYAAGANNNICPLVFARRV